MYVSTSPSPNRTGIPPCRDAPMPSARLALASSLMTVFLALPAHGQTPTDSARADSTKPKKTSRFGGLVNKAKSVTDNKVVQGAAKGVACTVVPGAAVAGAVTGSGPCANTMAAGVAGAAAK